MKAFEAKTKTSQAQYEIIMERIKSSTGNGLTSLRISDSENFSEEAIKMIAKEGFDVEIEEPYSICKKIIIISWKNSEEGREGVITRKFAQTQNTTPTPKKKTFWQRIGEFAGAGEGDW